MGKGTVDLSFALTTAPEPDTFLVPASLLAPVPSPFPQGLTEIPFEVGPAPVARDVTFPAISAKLEPPVPNLRISLLQDALVVPQGGKVTSKLVFETDGPLPASVATTVRVTATEG